MRLYRPFDVYRLSFQVNINKINSLSWSRIVLRKLTRKEISHILWNRKVYYRVYKCPLQVPTLSQINPVHVLPSHLNNNFNIILPLMHASSKWSLSLRFPHQNPLYTTPRPHTRYMLRPSHSSRFDHTTFCEEYRSLSSSLCSFLHSSVTSSPLGPNILLSTLFPNTLSLRSSPNLTDEVSHPYKTTSKIIVLCILTLYFCVSNWKAKHSEPNDSKRP